MVSVAIGRSADMTQHSRHHTWDSWPGWSTIAANNNTSFTLWFTGLPGTGKTTLAQLVKKALVARGYKVEIIDTQSLSYWLHHELHIEEATREELSQTQGYDAFMTYICSLLARNGIITIAVSVSPSQEARLHAREQIRHFIEVYARCPEGARLQRLQQLAAASDFQVDLYQPPLNAELSIDTGTELPERSTLRILGHLEQCGFVAPLWEVSEIADEEVNTVKARLKALGYLD